MTAPSALACPAPLRRHDRVQMAHGGGGRLMNDLIEGLLRPALGSQTHDGAVLDVPAGRLAFTTDSYVVHPLFFPGGSIGELAVNGTVNDLAMCGAEPRWLSLGLILEEGLPMEELERVVGAIAGAARAADVEIVTGDTKVVDRGRADGLYINTAGVGVVAGGVEIAPALVRPGDVVIINGDIGAHGMAIMSVREGLEFETTIRSDTAPLWEAVAALLAAGEVHCMRDLTRGGLTSALNEIAVAAGVGIEIDETAVSVLPEVAAACEILGFDPLYVANEGRFAAFAPAEAAEPLLAALRAAPHGGGAVVVGRVVAEHSGRVTVRSALGGSRLLDMFSGEQLPRIC